VTLQNDGILGWKSGAYALARIDDDSANPKSFPLPRDTPAGSSADWALSVTAPLTPGVHREVWRLQQSGNAIPGDLAVYYVVVPEGARELRDKLEQQIDEWREKGEQEVERIAQELARQVLEWLKTEAEERARTVCGVPAAGGMVLMGIVWSGYRRWRQQ
jgi:hypothetical protein